MRLAEARHPSVLIRVIDECDGAHDRIRTRVRLGVNGLPPFGAQARPLHHFAPIVPNWMWSWTSS